MYEGQCQYSKIATVYVPLYFVVYVCMFVVLHLFSSKNKSRNDLQLQGESEVM